METDASAFCRMVAETPDIPHAAARFGAWLIGAAELTGGFPLELTRHQIMRAGFERNGIHVPGMGGRYETINDSIQWLIEHGHIAVSDGADTSFGYKARVYSLTI